VLLAGHFLFVVLAGGRARLISGYPLSANSGHCVERRIAAVRGLPLNSQQETIFEHYSAVMYRFRQLQFDEDIALPSNLTSAALLYSVL
jgi:hypothetical protein